MIQLRTIDLESTALYRIDAPDKMAVTSLIHVARRKSATFSCRLAL